MNTLWTQQGGYQVSVHWVSRDYWNLMLFGPILRDGKRLSPLGVKGLLEFNSDAYCVTTNNGSQSTGCQGIIGILILTAPTRGTNMSQSTGCQGIIGIGLCSSAGLNTHSVSVHWVSRDYWNRALIAASCNPICVSVHWVSRDYWNDICTRNRVRYNVSVHWVSRDYWNS